MTHPWHQGEVRCTDTGDVDEVAIENPDFVHLERMDDGHWWLAISVGDDRLHINLHSDTLIQATAESEVADLELGFTGT